MDGCCGGGDVASFVADMRGGPTGVFSDTAGGGSPSHPCGVLRRRSVRSRSVCGTASCMSTNRGSVAYTGGLGLIFLLFAVFIWRRYRAIGLSL